MAKFTFGPETSDPTMPGTKWSEVSANGWYIGTMATDGYNYAFSGDDDLFVVATPYDVRVELSARYPEARVARLRDEGLRAIAEVERMLGFA